MTKLILLAAGRGSRLKFMTNDIPKCLNVYQEKTLLQHILDRAADVEPEFEEIILVGGYKWESLIPYGHTLLVNPNWNSTGPIGSLEVADRYLLEGDCVVSYTDIFFSLNFLQSCIGAKGEVFVPSNRNFLESWSSRQVNLLKDLESFKCRNGLILDIGKEIEDIESIQGQFAGLVRISPSAWSTLKASLRYEILSKLDFTSAIQKTIELGIEVSTVQVDGFWREFDEVSDFA